MYNCCPSLSGCFTLRRYASVSPESTTTPSRAIAGHTTVNVRATRRDHPVSQEISIDQLRLEGTDNRPLFQREMVPRTIPRIDLTEEAATMFHLKDIGDPIVKPRDPYAAPSSHVRSRKNLPIETTDNRPKLQTENGNVPSTDSLIKQDTELATDVRIRKQRIDSLFANATQKTLTNWPELTYEFGPKGALNGFYTASNETLLSAQKSIRTHFKAEYATAIKTYLHSTWETNGQNNSNPHWAFFEHLQQSVELPLRQFEPNNPWQMIWLNAALTILKEAPHIPPIDRQYLYHQLRNHIQIRVLQRILHSVESVVDYQKLLNPEKKELLSLALHQEFSTLTQTKNDTITTEKEPICYPFFNRLFKIDIQEPNYFEGFEFERTHH